MKESLAKILTTAALAMTVSCSTPRDSEPLEICITSQGNDVCYMDTDHNPATVEEFYIIGDSKRIHLVSPTSTKEPINASFAEIRRMTSSEQERIDQQYALITTILQSYQGGEENGTRR